MKSSFSTSRIVRRYRTTTSPPTFTRTETRCYRSLRKFEEVEEFKLTADMCRWDVMQHDRDTELQALEVFRMIDVSGDGLLDRGAFSSLSD